MHLIIKRIVDFIGALFLILLISPILIIISLLIMIEDKGNPFFLQERIGKNFKVFKIIKFRTMITNAEKIGTGVFTNENDSRITKTGKFLRRYSLDELAQIFNVLKGDMSFIGPRPPVTYFPYPIDNYPEEFKKRFSMKPGITGLAQISGRTNLIWQERFVYDIQYIENYNIVKDIEIIFKTILNVLGNKDVFPTEEFQKNNHKLNNENQPKN